jgi:hypothetical protein
VALLALLVQVAEARLRIEHVLEVEVVDDLVVAEPLLNESVNDLAVLGAVLFVPGAVVHG